MMSDIELDDVQVVDVTGKAHRDRPHRSHKKKCDCTPTLRCTSILIFVLIGAVYVAGVAVGNVLMFNSLETLDMRASNESINRLSMLILDDMSKLQQMVVTTGYSETAAIAIHNLITYPDMDEEDAVRALTLEAWNNTKDPTNSSRVIYGVSKEITYWALLDLNYTTRYAVYYPKGPNDTRVVGTRKHFPPPIIDAWLYKSVAAEVNNSGTFLKLLTPTEGDPRPMFISLEKIMNPNDPNKTVLGYIVGGRAIYPRMKQFSDDTPSCLVVQDGINGEEDWKDKGGLWDDDDHKMFDDEQVKTGGTFTPNKTFGGTPGFLKRENATVQKTNGRLCPTTPLFNATSTLMVGYFRLCGLDPKVYKENAGCFNVRVDRPMSMVDQGTAPVLSLSAVIIVLMIALCVFFVIFLDCVVLRRIVNLSNVIKKQTKGHAEALKDEDDTTALMSVGEEKHSEKHGKSGKSASGSTENSQATNSSDAVVTSGAPTPSSSPKPQRAKSARDELRNLKRAMEQNAIGLRKRLEAVNDSIKIQQQKIIHDKQAIQLLNLWRGRKDFFPGLRPDAMQLRYEPSRSVDDILSNPLAIEYLKTHCESDRTLENLWFILDVSWLQELETAEDNEEDEEKREQIHNVAAYAAKTIMKRYIAQNAPQQINVSAATFQKLREKDDHYTRQMFDDAVSEVKLMLNTDVLPRFQKSAAYSAMSETLYIDNSGGGEESEYSDETVSTAGSILTDNEEGENGGVTHVFAHTFKNLHPAFEVNHNVDTSSASSSHSTTTTATGAAAPSLITGTLTSASDDGAKPKEEKKKEPAKEKDEKSPLKQEEPVKKESSAENSSNSTESSSSNSISSDSESGSSPSSSSSSSSTSTGTLSEDSE